MKRVLTTILFFSLMLSSGFAQKPGRAAAPVSVVNTHQVVPSEAAIGIGIRDNDSIVKAIQSEIQSLKKENELYRTTIDVNSNLFGGISTYFAIVAILLSIIVIAIPVVNYFLVLKPNARMVAKVEGLENEVLAKIEKNFENYFENLRGLKKQQVLALLDDPLKISEVTGYFLLNDSSSLTEAETQKIIAFLKEENGVEKSDLYILNSLVIHSGFPNAERYYKSIFERDDSRNYEYAIKYLVQNNFPEHIPYVEKIIAAAGDSSHKLLLGFYDYISENYIGNWHNKKAPEKKEMGIRFCKLLFNSDRIMQAIEGHPVPGHPIMGAKMNINVITRNPFLRETRYYSVYLKEEDEKYNKR